MVGAAVVRATVGGRTEVVGANVVVGGNVVVGAAVVVGARVVVCGCVVIGADWVVGATGGITAAATEACALQRGVSQQFNEQFRIAPLRVAFTMLHALPEQRKLGKHPLELMSSFRAPSKACSV